MRLIAGGVFVVLLVVLLPLMVLGAALVTYKQMVVSRRLGASQTAIRVINACPTRRFRGCGYACSRCGSSTS